ncbi:pyridine nucleotide-disulfide oxidoreductase [Solicola gregarius]|uniref:Tetratricopeptide repeat protein 38 n=1 Tax=Solicola gregarius TaxID=2908642 RepID=A0AA46TGH8_9ACTN|nr:pyridine nucleotide-disulfide oxidoreductase [Solicola gregarius]UYM04891.1 pyridine nucleotide-disulfide oxidoreductase [Solicola gregarius]
MPVDTSSLTARSAMPVDLYGLRLTTSPEAATHYNDGLRALLAVRRGGVEAVAASIAMDPTFALGHATLALMGHELGANVNLPARVASALRHARRSSERERSHVHAVVSHLQGDSDPLIAHVRAYPRDALLLSVAVPTIAFSGVTAVPAQAWQIVEDAAPAYGDDWWFSGLLGFVRQEQGRFDEAMDLACRSLRENPGAGHSVHARAHVHYETGDHDAGLAWITDWIDTSGPDADNLAHFSWHAALHELSNGDLLAVRRRFESELAPPRVTGCRALVDSASLLWRWSLTPGADAIPDARTVLDEVSDRDLFEPDTPFLAMHAALGLCAAGDEDGLGRLRQRCAAHDDRVQREVASTLCEALLSLRQGAYDAAADRLGGIATTAWRLGGSDAQREVIEDTRIAALIAAGRNAEAAAMLDTRLDRRHARRDQLWRGGLRS